MMSARTGNKNSFKHGHGKMADGKSSPTYYAWVDMRRRCDNATHPAYKWYGERGIRYCQEWASFAAFFADMGEKPSGDSLDRIDNDGHYSPENCRWATKKEQNNNKRTNHLLTVGEETKTVQQWADQYGRNPTTILERLRRGWEASRAVLEPPRKYARR